MSEKKFKVGDKVKVVKTNPKWARYVTELEKFVGGEFEVLRVDNESCAITKFPQWWLDFNCLELVQDEPEQFMFQGYPLNVGDTLWSFMEGYTEVLQINLTKRAPIETNYCVYLADGRMDDDFKFATLFWDKPQFELPKKPKPKVKKYLVLFKRNDDSFGITTEYYKTLENLNGMSQSLKGIHLILESEKEF
ncbi:MAG: hypothetical protein PHT07_20830 [Paludibacter sp.]|nr:hypothetical protein [Paludibacter sp.]